MFWGLNRLEEGHGASEIFTASLLSWALLPGLSLRDQNLIKETLFIYRQNPHYGN